MRSLLLVWRIFARRGLSNWRMLSVLALGVVVAATLLASAPIYARTMADLGLTFQIRQDLADQPSTRVEFTNVPIQTQDGVALRGVIEQRIDQRIGWFAASTERYLRAPWMVTAKQGKDPVQTNPFGQLQSLTGYASHVTVVAGRLPQPTGPGQPIEVVLGSTAFRQSGFAVGDAFTFYEDFDTCERALPPPDAAPPPFPCKPQATVSFSYPAVVVGVIDPVDAADHFWVRGASAYFDSSRPLDGTGPVLPMFTDESSLLNGFGSVHPGYPVTLAYNVFADPSKLSRSNFQRARNDIHALYDEFSPIGGGAFSPLTTTLDRFGTSENFQQVPLTILLLEIAAVALFYVVLMSAVVVERQAMEIALLRSRGATTGQVISLYVLEGLVVGVPVMLVAPFLAAATTALLGFTPIFKNVANYSLLPVTVSPMSFGLAGLGVLLSLLALVAPAFVVSRRSAVSQRRAEGRPGVSLLQRYYLDFALVLIAGMLLWELNQRGSVFTPSPSGGVSSDPLLLASPALIILAAAAILLRVYPMVLKLAAKTLAAGAGVTVTIGLWQVVRSPGQYTRLTLLLMMAVAVGTFAASYSSTTERSYRDRAAFETGVDWRAAARNEGQLGTNGSDADALLGAIPGVAGATSVLRTTGGLAVTGIGGQNLQILALNPAEARNYLWFRNDFADHSLNQLMDALGPPGEFQGDVLPVDAATFSVWVYTAESRDQLTLWAGVRDSTGQFNY
ncbi:MAG TPA: FtsX-like permease family protein, partial [Tepidiformaceae bacterium]